MWSVECGVRSEGSVPYESLSPRLTPLCEAKGVAGSRLSLVARFARRAWSRTLPPLRPARRAATSPNARRELGGGETEWLIPLPSLLIPHI